MFNLYFIYVAAIAYNLIFLPPLLVKLFAFEGKMSHTLLSVIAILLAFTPILNDWVTLSIIACQIWEWNHRRRSAKSEA